MVRPPERSSGTQPGLPREAGVFASGLRSPKNVVSDPEIEDQGRGHLPFTPDSQILPTQAWCSPGPGLPGTAAGLALPLPEENKVQGEGRGSYASPVFSEE